jgi:diguanylate cyclase (GGDEF)-like protein
MKRIMLEKHSCPCCSQPLLRHVSFKRIFWFCNHCYQEMPDLSNFRKTALDTQHWLSKTITARQQRKEEWPQRVKRPSEYIPNTELQPLTCIDRLTQIGNRRRFQAYLEQEWQQMAQEQAPLSLILCDLDCFKIYNDTYGHEAGDQCLQRVEQAVVRTLKRPAQLVPSYGGEEFVVIVPNADKQEAVRVAEDIRSAVKALKIALTNSHPSQYLTLSVGVATLVPMQENSCAMLMKAAERALERAKIQGRTAESASGSNHRVILHETLLQETPRVEEKKLFLLQNNESTPVHISVEHNGAFTKIDLLKSYVAYYVSRGNKIISPLSGSLPFKESVYQYWGYHDAFQDFWQQLTARRDFPELYIEGDVHCFGQFLDVNCTLGECARCNLPIPMSESHAYDRPNCTLCHPSDLSWQGLDRTQAQNNKHIVAIGTSPTEVKILKEWFSLNGFQVTFVTNPEDIQPQSLPPTVDLVLIYGLVSEAEGKAWAHELTRYPQFQGVPIVALSAEAGGGLPWIERTLGLEDYLLSPQGGDRLAHHLRHLLKPQLRDDTPELYWFPR